MAVLMYNAWRKHGVKPSEIFKMSEAERLVIKAFYLFEHERKA